MRKMETDQDGRTSSVEPHYAITNEQGTGRFDDPLGAFARDGASPLFYGIAFDATALTFNAIWQYARRHRLLSEALDAAGVAAIGRRFQLALAWLTTGALLGLLIPFLGVAVIAAFNAFYWLPIRGESPRARSSTSTRAGVHAVPSAGQNEAETADTNRVPGTEPTAPEDRPAGADDPAGS